MRAPIVTALVAAWVGVLLAALLRAEPTPADVIDAASAGCPPDLPQPAVFVYWLCTFIAFAPMSAAMPLVNAAARLIGPSTLSRDWDEGDRTRAEHIMRRAFDACDSLHDAEGKPLAPRLGMPRVGAAAFAGGGHKVTGYFGQLYYLAQHDLLANDTQLYGCSTGAPIAAMLAPSLRLSAEARVAAVRAVCASVVQGELEMGANARRIALAGRAWEMWPRLLRIFRAHLPTGADGVRALDGQLHIALTRPFAPAPSWLVSSFADVDELLHALTASGTIPFNIVDRPFVRFRSHAVVDGGYANLAPTPRAERFGGRPVARIVNQHAADFWTENSLLAHLLDQLRIGMPLWRDDDFVADIANGYRSMHEQLLDGAFAS